MVEQYKPTMSFDGAAAEAYDDSVDPADEAAVDFLLEQARGGPALELAIGTGRVALPLASRGVRVDGIDFSAAMVAKMQGKPGGDDIAVTIGDFADVPVEGSYRLIFVVFNSLFNLLTQDDQVRCFENVAAHLTDDGVFVVEAFVPTSLMRLTNNQYVAAESIGVHRVIIGVGGHDPVSQRLDESHVILSREGIQLYPEITRYAWPSELDLMARIAGLRLRERWGGWARQRFDAASSTHVSLYGR